MTSRRPSARGCMHVGMSRSRSLVVAMALSAAAPMVSLASPGCGGSQAGPSAAEQAMQSVQTPLVAGPWRLVDYRPALALDPMTQALLAQQIRAMVVSFDGRTLRAQSPTLSLVRPYAIENAAGPIFDLVSPDVQGGGTLRSHCVLRDDGRGITFQAQTEPWNGTGVLERDGP
jgi:hypothetical protein